MTKCIMRLALCAILPSCTTYTTSAAIVEGPESVAAKDAKPTAEVESSKPVETPPAPTGPGLGNQAERKLLFSTREGRSKEPTKKSLSPSDAQALLRQLFPKFLTSDKQCRITPEASKGLEESRRMGQLVPTVLSAYEGTFTKANRKETLLIVNVGECGATHAEGFGSKRIVVVADNVVVLNHEDGANSVLGIADIDGNGLSEIVFASGDMNQGILTEQARLVSLSNGSLRVIRDFGQVLESTCASAEANGDQSTSVWPNYSAGNRTPSIQVESHTDSCP